MSLQQNMILIYLLFQNQSINMSKKFHLPCLLQQIVSLSFFLFIRHQNEIFFVRTWSKVVSGGDTLAMHNEVLKAANHKSRQIQIYVRERKNDPGHFCVISHLHFTFTTFCSLVQFGCRFVSSEENLHFKLLISKDSQFKFYVTAI